jgi:hypothetical protein
VDPLNSSHARELLCFTKWHWKTNSRLRFRINVPACFRFLFTPQLRAADFHQLKRIRVCCFTDVNASKQNSDTELLVDPQLWVISSMARQEMRKPEGSTIDVSLSLEYSEAKEQSFLTARKCAVYGRVTSCQGSRRPNPKERFLKHIGPLMILQWNALMLRAGQSCNFDHSNRTLNGVSFLKCTDFYELKYQFWLNPASYTMGTGSFPAVRRPWRGVNPHPI